MGLIAIEDQLCLNQAIHSLHPLIRINSMTMGTIPGRCNEFLKCQDVGTHFRFWGGVWVLQRSRWSSTRRCHRTSRMWSTMGLWYRTQHNGFLSYGYCALRENSCHWCMNQDWDCWEWYQTCNNHRYQSRSQHGNQHGYHMQWAWPCTVSLNNRVRVVPRDLADLLQLIMPLEWSVLKRALVPLWREVTAQVSVSRK